MTLDWILSPFTQSAMLAAGLSLLLYLFCSLKIEMRAIERAAERKVSTLGTPVDPGIAELEKRLDHLAFVVRQSPEGSAETGALRPGLNLERRVHALRRHRRGETAEQIALSIGAPAGEVRLMITVHRILMERTIEGSNGRQSSVDAANALKTPLDPADRNQ